MNERELRETIVEVGRRLYARGYTASNDGNISTRLDDRRLLMTPKSVCKGFMTPDMMVITDLEGKKLAGERDPSSEMQMHLEVYRQRPDAGAVVHAHPPIATGFAVAGIPLDRAVLAEVVTTLGSVPIAEYATPSTKELPEAVRKYVKVHDGMLLANHGALTLGNTILTSDSFTTLGNDIRTYYARQAGDAAAMGAYGFNRTGYGFHEMGHTFQYQILGIFYPIFYLFNHPFTAASPFENAADRYGAGQGSWWPGH